MFVSSRSPALITAAGGHSHSNGKRVRNTLGFQDIEPSIRERLAGELAKFPQDAIQTYRIRTIFADSFRRICRSGSHLQVIVGLSSNGPKMSESAATSVTLAQAERSWLNTLIRLGAGLFVVALAGSAIVVPQLRLLHFFQALIYVAVVALTPRKGAWAYGAGVAIACVWNGLQLFVTHNAQGGLIALWSYLHTGEARRIDTMLVSLGTLGHFLLIAGCLAAFLPGAGRAQWWRFLGGAVIGLAYFALIVALLLPH